LDEVIAERLYWNCFTEHAASTVGVLLPSARNFSTQSPSLLLALYLPRGDNSTKGEWHVLLVIGGVKNRESVVGEGAYRIGWAV